MQGEVQAKQREKNGLLDNELEFDQGLASKIEIEPEQNQNFEAIIKQRILDLAFDDRSLLEFKRKQLLKVQSQPKEMATLDFEKDTRGLMGVYEDEYKKKVQGIDIQQTKEDKLKDQIKELYGAICYSIDFMSNFKVQPGDNKLLKDQKTSNEFIVEEKVPVIYMSREQGKSYQEVHRPLKKDLLGKQEMTKEDKNAIRRKIKKHKKNKRKRMEEKELLKTGLSQAEFQVLKKNKSTMEKKIKDSKVKQDFTKSASFFQNMAQRQTGRSN